MNAAAEKEEPFAGAIAAVAAARAELDSEDEGEEGEVVVKIDFDAPCRHHSSRRKPTMTTMSAIAAVAAARAELLEREEAARNGADMTQTEAGVDARANAEIREAAQKATAALSALRGLLQRQVARNNNADSASAQGGAVVLDNDNNKKQRRKCGVEIAVNDYERSVDGNWDSPVAQARAAKSVSAAESALAALEPLLVDEANPESSDADADADADADVNARKETVAAEETGGEHPGAGAEATLPERGRNGLGPQSPPDDPPPRRLFRRCRTPALAEAYHRLDAALASRRSADFRMARTYRTLFLGACDQLRQSAAGRKYWDDEVARRAEEVRRAELAEPCAWNRKLERLRKFREEHGHANPKPGPPRRKRDEWGKRRMTKKTKGRTTVNLANGEALGEQGEDQGHSVDQLQFYDREMESEDEDIADLGRWLDAQQAAYKKRRLAPQRARALEELGVEWTAPREAKWKNFYEELKRFKGSHGHCRVPIDFPPNPKLSKWAQHQRQAESLMRRGEPSLMTPGRFRLLDEIGFTWADTRTKWQDRFEELIRYREVHGHCRVPWRYKPNPQLGNWVGHQRRYYFLQQRGVVNAASRSLTEERKSKLDSVGFDWTPERKSWDERFDELCTYQLQYQKVAPTRGENKEYASLALWVRKQRMYFRMRQEGKPAPVTDEQIERLISIGVHSSEPMEY